MCIFKAYSWTCKDGLVCQLSLHMERFISFFFWADKKQRDSSPKNKKINLFISIQVTRVFCLSLYN